MARLIVVLSGHVSSGKTTLATALAEHFTISVLRTRDLLLKHVGDQGALTRADLQALGDKLDANTGGRWVADELARHMAGDADTVFVVDSVKIRQQIDSIRELFGLPVVHIHLTASREVLKRRYTERPAERIKELDSYEAALQNATENTADALAAEADMVIDTEQAAPQDVLTRSASYLGLYGSTDEALVDVLVGGQYGSEGKGHIASFLAREYQLLVRGGGPNAGHRVYLESGETYTHHHLPSGTLRSNANLLLVPGAVVSVEKLLREIADCSISPSRLTIDPQVMLISGEDIDSEAEIVSSIGSTGQGVGAATARRIRRTEGVELARDCEQLQPFLRPASEILREAFAKKHRVFVEGTQGFGLSLYHGPYPYVTSRDTSTAGCLAEAGIPPRRVRKVVMVCRTYPIRVESPSGRTSGPMSQEIDFHTIEKRAGLSQGSLEPIEVTSTTGRRRRVSEFDWDLLRQASWINGPTDVALTFVDYLQGSNQNARRFDQLDANTIRFIEEVERVARAPVSLISTRFHTRSIIDRRAW